MPNGNQLPFTWEDYKAYLKDVVALIDYPGFRDAPEREEDLERRISEAEAMLGANPEAAFTAANLSLLVQLPYFNYAFQETTGTSLTQWYNLYTKALPEEILPEEISPTEWEREQFEWQQQQALWGRERAEEEGAWQRERAMLPWTMGMTPAEQAQTAQWGAAGRQAEMQEAYRLAALGETGWIERWYAREAQRAQRWQPQPTRWDKVGFRNPYVAYLRTYKPERLQELVAKGFAPQEMVTEPLARFGEPYPRPEEYTYGAAPAEERVTISPEGEVKITVPSGAPMAGRAAVEGQPPISGKYPRVERGEAPPFRAGEFVTPTPRPRGARKRPSRPTAPPMPEELAPFLPAGVPGEPIQKGWQIPPPSAQLWGRTPPSVRSKLAGYAQYGGGLSYEDLMWRQQQRQMPARAGRWGVPRQWT